MIGPWLRASVTGEHFSLFWDPRSTIDPHDESMEVTKDLQKNCAVTLNQSNADSTIMLNRESKKNRGLLRSLGDRPSFI